MVLSSRFVNCQEVSIKSADLSAAAVGTIAANGAVNKRQIKMTSKNDRNKIIRLRKSSKIYEYSSTKVVTIRAVDARNRELF